MWYYKPENKPKNNGHGYFMLVEGRKMDFSTDTEALEYAREKVEDKEEQENQK